AITVLHSIYRRAAFDCAYFLIGGTLVGSIYFALNTALTNGWNTLFSNLLIIALLFFVMSRSRVSDQKEELTRERFAFIGMVYNLSHITRHFPPLLVGAVCLVIPWLVLILIIALPAGF